MAGFITEISSNKRFLLLYLASYFYLFLSVLKGFLVHRHLSYVNHILIKLGKITYEKSQCV